MIIIWSWNKIYKLFMTLNEYLLTTTNCSQAYDVNAYRVAYFLTNVNMSYKFTLNPILLLLFWNLVSRKQNHHFCKFRERGYLLFSGIEFDLHHTERKKLAPCKTRDILISCWGGKPTQISEQRSDKFLLFETNKKDNCDAYSLFFCFFVQGNDRSDRPDD